MWFWFLLAAGVLRFLLEATGPDRLRTWQIFLVNLLFWPGMAQGALVFAATHEIFPCRRPGLEPFRRESRWGDALKSLESDEQVKAVGQHLVLCGTGAPGDILV